MPIDDTITIERRREGEVLVLALQGSLSDDGLERARVAIGEALGSGARYVALDLGGVRYISSSGIGLLVSMQKQSAQSGADLALCAMNRDLWELFSLTRLDQVFTLASTVDAWRRSLGGSRGSA